MAEEKLGLHVDNDWKKQAQEEKRKLAEQEEKRKTAATTPAGVVPGAAGGGPPSGPAGARQAAGRGAGQGQGQGGREIPQASFATLVQSLLTQVLFYLGDLSTRGGEPMVNLDMAKHNIDTLSIIEDKTRNNLSDDEKRLLDAALYEARMRYVALASRYAELP
jgi:hypothetical protein